jgi:Zn-dependent protease
VGKTFGIGQLFGIQFRLHISWFIIFILITGVLVHPNYSQLPDWIVGIVTSLLFFTSVLIHELAHSLVGRANGIPFSSITLFIFGGVALMTREAPRPSAELKMALAGPLSSLALGGLFGLIWLAFRGSGSAVESVVAWLAIMNLILAVFNLIPGFPLDGGRVFRSLLWHFTGNYTRSSQIAARVGQTFGLLLVFSGLSLIVLEPFHFTWYDGLWITTIGLFLGSAASGSYRQAKTGSVFGNINAIDNKFTNKSSSLSDTVED